ncbi:MAG TPA: hypothetical protein VH016_17945, partial [Actinomycetota bacterium]|nr:hypothetical protein [Actinomycetota bacterium]
AAAFQAYADAIAYARSKGTLIVGSAGNAVRLVPGAHRPAGGAGRLGHRQPGGRHLGHLPARDRR